MEDSLRFNPENFTIEEANFQGETVLYRCYRDIIYIRNPISSIQKLNIYVPCSLYDNSDIGNYTLETAPILILNSVGGYLAGECRIPSFPESGRDDFSFWALKRDMVVVSPGVRGRDTKNGEGENIGVAPAVICDLKAVVRYLKYNAGLIPGDVDKIITNGTSAGGAVSALQGITGNHPDYEETLDKMGAAKAGDDVFASSCYCPITNLEHADMAYEWEFGRIFDENLLTNKQITMSKRLKDLFSDYLGSLGLTTEELEYYIKNKILQSVQRQLDAGMDLKSFSWIKIQDNCVLDIDFDGYIQYRTRKKDVPAFDAVDLSTPENNLFGTKHNNCRHFTKFSYQMDKAHADLAEERIVRMMNPMNYIYDSHAKKAKYFRIRHGMLDRDTSLAIPALLAKNLEEANCIVDFAYPWGITHDGDYDRDEFFSWVEKICS